MTLYVPMILWVGTLGSALLGWPATAQCGAGWVPTNICGLGYVCLTAGWGCWLGCLHSTPCGLSAQLPSLPQLGLLRSKKVQLKTSGPSGDSRGGSHSVTSVAHCWSKQVAKLAQSQEVGNTSTFNGRSCREIVATFNPPRVGTPHSWNKGPKKLPDY